MNYFNGNLIFNLEISNLLSLAKLIIKELIESSMKNNRVCNSDDRHLHNFFVLLENLLQHGIKPKPILLALRKDLWTVLQSISNFVPESSGIEESINEITTIKTPIGKVRAWLRFAFVQKRLSDYFRVLLDNREHLLNDCYEKDAFLYSDDAVLLQGLTVGLNIIDCNWCAKDEDLDNLNSLIDFTFYLRDVKTPVLNECTKCKDKSNIDLILDQKNYLEEVNRNLNSKIYTLQKRINMLESNSLVHNKITNKTNFDQQKSETPSTDGDNISFGDSFSNLLTSLEIQLKQEKEKNEKLEKKFMDLVSQKNESDTALRLLENSIHEKQDTIITLRTQLEEVKAINIKIFNQIKEKDAQIKSKIDQTESLEQQNSSLNSTILRLELKSAALHKKRDELEEVIKQLNDQILDKDNQQFKLENELKKEKEYNLSLEKSLKEQKKTINSLQTELKDLKVKCSEVDELTREHSRLKRSCQDYELSLEQIGVLLKDSKLEAENLKEISGFWKDAVWVKNTDAQNCFHCMKPFSVTRRRHHCRNCGNIYCSDCSGKKMPLPSSSKPVRVCDRCNLLLLDRYCAN